MTTFKRSQVASLSAALLSITGVICGLIAPVASADPTNVTQTSWSTSLFTTGSLGVGCSGGTITGGAFTVPNAGDYVIVQAGIGFGDSATSGGHYVVDTLNTPTDSQGNTYTLINASGVGGASTGHWAGMWMAKASSAGNDTASWGCSNPGATTQAAGMLVGTFTSNGASHSLSVDTSNGMNWNYYSGGSASVTNTTSATSAAGDLVVSGGYIREHAWNGYPLVVSGGEPNLTYVGVNYGSAGNTTTSGTAWCDSNSQFGTGHGSTWSAGSNPSETYNFSAYGISTDYPYSVGALVTAALTAS